MNHLFDRVRDRRRSAHQVREDLIAELTDLTLRYTTTLASVKGASAYELATLSSASMRAGVAASSTSMLAARVDDMRAKVAHLDHVATVAALAPAYLAHRASLGATPEELELAAQLFSHHCLDLCSDAELDNKAHFIEDALR